MPGLLRRGIEGLLEGLQSGPFCGPSGGLYSDGCWGAARAKPANFFFSSAFDRELLSLTIPSDIIFAGLESLEFFRIRRLPRRARAQKFFEFLCEELILRIADAESGSVRLQTNESSTRDCGASGSHSRSSPS